MQTGSQLAWQLAWTRGLKNHHGAALPLKRRAVARCIDSVVFGAALLLGTAPDTALAAQRITAVRVGLQQDHTRIVFESDTPLRFTLFSLRNPERAELELEGVEQSAVLAGLTARVGPNHPYIKCIRAEQATPDRVRVKIDFSREVEPRILALQPMDGHAYRLVLDIYLPQPANSLSTAAQAALPPSPPGPHASGQATFIPSSNTAADSAKPATAGPSSMEEIWLAVRINRQEQLETVLLLRRNDDRLLARGEDLRHWRLRMPDIAPLSYGGDAYYPLDALRGLSYRVDDSTQTLDMDAPPGLFGMTEIRGTPADFIRPTPAPPGGFFNYDLFVDHAQGKNQANGLFELGAFDRWGAGTSTFVGRNLGNGSSLVRLDTTWTHDQPAQLATLRLGDAIGGAGSWGRSVRFGGVQWATKFSTQPGFNTLPLPGLAGEAVLPSTVDLYINDALRMRRDVPAGPFSIQDLPVVTGQGEARLVVRDMLGREQVITHPYYASPRLLQQGLHDYSYELGFLRENFGIANNDYGRLMAAGTHRLGLTDRITGELRGELLAGQQTIGLGGAWLWPGAGAFSASLAASNSTRGTGRLLGLGFERQGRLLSLGVNTQLADRHFSQLGLQPEELAPRQINRAFVGIGTGYGSLALSYTLQDRRDQNELRLLSASYSASLGKLGFLSLSLLRFLGNDPKMVIGLSFTSSLDERTSASVNSSVDPRSKGQALMQVQRNLPSGSGVGYRLRAGTGDSDLREVSFSAQNTIGTYAVEAARLRGRTDFRASASGGLALMGGDAFLNRRINDSFAVVQVPDYANVRIYADNQLIARTGVDGSALLPRLRAYEKNSIRIEQADLPLDAEINTLQLDAVPYFRSGLALQFPVNRSRGALITVVLDNGMPLPAGAVATIGEGKEEFPTGQRGEIYLTGLASSNRLHVSWHGQGCELVVPFPESPEPLPHLGTYTCNGVKP